MTSVDAHAAPSIQERQHGSGFWTWITEPNGCHLAPARSLPVGPGFEDRPADLGPPRRLVVSVVGSDQVVLPN